jgi:hypothetical protein
MLVAFRRKISRTKVVVAMISKSPRFEFLLIWVVRKNGALLTFLNSFD